MHWRLAPDHPEEQTLRLELERLFELHPIIARLLVRRGLRDEKSVRRFLTGTLSDLPDPFALPDMDFAVERILRAIETREKIVVFGDYDVDGISGTAQLCAYLREVGARPVPLLPHRMHDGYGLTEKSVNKIAAEKPDLLITIDNGTKSFSEIAHLKGLGADVIVIDHHETPTPETWPPVVAMVNPKRVDSKFVERDIASAGLVFLLLMALRARARERGLSPLPNLKRYLDLACLGTIADVVPLIGTNRLLVKFGLQEAGSSLRPGIKALREISDTSPPLTVTHVAFRLAPRINAAGRLSDPKLALDLLLSEDMDEARAAALRLEELNRERQTVEAQVTREAFAQIEEEQADRQGIVAAGEGWHLGVVGIVAAKLTERFGRPAIALTINAESGQAKGSARTVGNFSVHEALKAIEPLMSRFGGHAAAAGMTVDLTKLEDFKNAFNDSVHRLWDSKSESSVEADSDLPFSEIGTPLLRDLERLEPFGPGNPEPQFSAFGVRLESCRLVGNSGGTSPGHLKAIFCQNGARFDGIGFGQGQYLKTALASPLHQVLFLPQRNEWNGRSSLQLKIKKITPNT